MQPVKQLSLIEENAKWEIQEKKLRISLNFEYYKEEKEKD